MRYDLSDDVFREGAEEWLASLDDATLIDLPKVFSVSPGYYPTTLYELWQCELGRRGLSVDVRAAKAGGLTQRLPVSHPQDYDWRFTPGTARDLVRRAAEHLTAGACLAHVGTPSTFLVGTMEYDTYRHVLLERNTATTAALDMVSRRGSEVICIDLAECEPPRLDASAAIIDPPWYLGDTQNFLTAASQLCRDGALLWLCQPALATRPGVDKERSFLISEVALLGLTIEASYACAVRYQMPHFEAMSLRRSADIRVPQDWRTGDLLVLRKGGAPQRPNENHYKVHPWLEVSFGPVRIRLRANEAHEDLGTLVPAADILDTVSRRDPVRKHIGFWTSGNRVYSLANPDKIGKLIELCDTDLANTSFSMARTLIHAAQVGIPAHVAQKLFDVLLVELQEHTAIEAMPSASGCVRQLAHNKALPASIEQKHDL
jgi:hypothetical protein